MNIETQLMKEFFEEEIKKLEKSNYSYAQKNILDLKFEIDRINKGLLVF